MTRPRTEIIRGAVLDTLMVEGPKPAEELAFTIQRRALMYGIEATLMEVVGALRWLRARGYARRNGNKCGAYYISGGYRGATWEATA